MSAATPWIARRALSIEWLTERLGASRPPRPDDSPRPWGGFSVGLSKAHRPHVRTTPSASRPSDSSPFDQPLLRIPVLIANPPELFSARYCPSRSLRISYRSLSRAF